MYSSDVCSLCEIRLTCTMSIDMLHAQHRVWSPAAPLQRHHTMTKIRKSKQNCMLSKSTPTSQMTKMSTRTVLLRLGLLHACRLCFVAYFLICNVRRQGRHACQLCASNTWNPMKRQKVSRQLLFTMFGHISEKTTSLHLARNQQCSYYCHASAVDHQLKQPTCTVTFL